MPDDHGDLDQPAGEPLADDSPPDISGWAAAARTANCPACGAPGALSLGGGLFCPSCGVTSTESGYQPSDS